MPSSDMDQIWLTARPWVSGNGSGLKIMMQASPAGPTLPSGNVHSSSVKSRGTWCGYDHEEVSSSLVRPGKASQETSPTFAHHSP